MIVSLGARPTPPGRLGGLLRERPPSTIADALALAEFLGHEEPESTRDRWETLATLAAHDLGVVRAIEPHLDAVGIFAQAGLPMPRGAWGVFAAEGGDDPLVATGSGDSWLLSGTKHWCSLADRLDGALVTATADGTPRLFAVDLAHPGIALAGSDWVARGFSEISSAPLHFDRVEATGVGGPGWYLQRPGFAWGGIGVAACWFGGAVGIGRAVHAAARRAPNPFLLDHLGAIDELLGSSRRALAEAAALIDMSEPEPRRLAKRVRATVARAGEEILWRAGHALGPTPLAFDAEYAKRAADLGLYLRQHHAERDVSSLGGLLAEEDAPW